MYELGRAAGLGWRETEIRSRGMREQDKEVNCDESKVKINFGEVGRRLPQQLEYVQN